jgi:hypothetical protein
VVSALLESSNLPGFNYGPLDKAMGAQIAWYNAQFHSGFGSIFPDNRHTRIINLGYDPTGARAAPFNFF